MHFSSCLAFAGLTCSLVSAGRTAKSIPHLRDILQKRASGEQDPKKTQTYYKPIHNSPPQYLTPATQKYVVNGSAIPEVDFNIGESYAGLMPLTKNPGETNQMYFWFFPSENKAAADEILIWFNGGPGCSSLEGVLQENGPFIWQYGTLKPVANPWTWNNLTNVVYVDQPIGTGFSQGKVTATSEETSAAQFLQFWTQFVDTFALKGRKVFLTGESYAGNYVPYIAAAMLDKKDTNYFNVEATMIYDPTLVQFAMQSEIPAVQFADHHANLFPFNDTFKAALHQAADKCGYTKYMDKYLTYPPPGPFPAQIPGTKGTGVDMTTTDDCEVWGAIYSAATSINPCFDFYSVSTTCPVLWDVLGFPGSFTYMPEHFTSNDIYFNRADVKAAINAPKDVVWNECTDKEVFVKGVDTSEVSAFTVLPSVIDRTKRTIIGHGQLDMILIANGSLLAIQNMTWGGKQGFQTAPKDAFYVPYHTSPDLSTLSASGVMGTTHTERKLTWVNINLSGHMIPQYQPSSSYRTLEFLLGRIDSLSSIVPFTTDSKVAQPQQVLGAGTAP